MFTPCVLERRAGHANRASHRTDLRSREGTRTAHPASEKRGTEVRRELLNEEASNLSIYYTKIFEPREPTVGNDC